MILLGTYGDALGALLEPAALQGNVGLPDAARQLSPASAYQPPGKTGAPWWVWLDGDHIPPDTRGVPTDDSAFRLILLHSWLADLNDEERAEDSFRAWLQNKHDTVANVTPGSWQERQYAQIRDWLIMLDDAERWSAVSSTLSIEEFQVTTGNPFFRPGIPVVFGMFMYLEYAALFAQCDPLEVRNHFSTFCSLDQGYAGEITGLFSGLISSAVAVSTSEIPFTNWYIDTLRSQLAVQDIHVGNQRLSDIIESIWDWGTSRRSYSELEIVWAIKTDIYETPLPGNRDQLGYRVFDPLLFLQQMTATVAYATEGIPQILTLLACNPGDADTIPSMFGSIAGAWYGMEALTHLSPTLSDDLGHVQRTVSTLFDYDLERVVHSLVRLSRTITCT